MAGAADLKEDAVLALHLNFFVVEPARKIHRAKYLQHLFATKTRFLLLWLSTTAPRHGLDCSHGRRLRLAGGLELGLRRRRRYSLGRESFLRKFAFGFLYQSKNFGVTHDCL